MGAGQDNGPWTDLGWGGGGDDGHTEKVAGQDHGAWAELHVWDSERE